MDIQEKRVFWRVVIYLMLAAVVLSLRKGTILTSYFFLTHDLYVVLGIVASLMVAIYWRPNVLLPNSAPPAMGVVALAVVLSLALWGGTYWLMFDYPVSRDEQMAAFDAVTYSHGLFAGKLPDEWAGYGLAFMGTFALATEGHTLLVSNYLPINSTIRGLFGLLGDQSLMNPVLAGIGFVALYSLARRLLADCPTAIWVVLGGYLLSAQILVTAMTAYSMTAHLVLNLIWLVLFLHDKWWSHALAMIVGLLAMGLHQFVFHPLFAGPFILILAWQRRWPLFVAYGAAYLAWLFIWISYPGFVVEWGGAVSGGHGSGGAGNYWTDRILPLISRIEPGAVPLMLYNLMRATAWNAAFLLPFLGLAVPLWKRRDPIVMALYGGLMLTILAMAILLPYQGHGWGYRYIHGLLGNALLLAGFGYREWAARNRQAADGAIALLGAMSLIAFVPSAMASAHRFTKPHAQLYQVIAQQDADFVVVDDTHFPHMVDEVRNQPDLNNRPLVLSRFRMEDDERLMALCQRGRVAVMTEADGRAAGLVGANRDAPPLAKNYCETGAPDGEVK